jgi:hypothetical protein
MRDRRNDGNTLLTQQQAAARLRKPPDQVRDLIEGGQIQPAIAKPLRLRARDLDAYAEGEDAPRPSRPAAAVQPLRPWVREMRCLACSRTLALATPAGDKLRVFPPRGSNVVLLTQTPTGPRCKRCGGRPYLDDSDAGTLAS